MAAKKKPRSRSRARTGAGEETPRRARPRKRAARARPEAPPEAVNASPRDAAPDEARDEAVESATRGVARSADTEEERLAETEGAADGPGIPPLPDDEEELVPLEDEEPPPARDVSPDASAREVLEAVRRGEVHVSALNRLDDAAVEDLAREVGVEPRPGERRSETLYRLLQRPAARPPVESSFVEGLLELHPDGYGFLRRPERNYVQHPMDVYVAAGLVRQLRLQPGHWVSGTARPARPGEPLLALARVEEVNHEEIDARQGLRSFEDLTVVYPNERFLLETVPSEIEMRVMDLFCPLGRGQRAIITSPPRAGKTVLLQKLADAIAHNSPNVDIVVLLVDERPEEVTNMRRSVRGEVIASTFDRPAANHVRIAELVMEKVKRMVEFGRQVVLLLDSITRLGRAYNNLAGPSGRILTGGLEAKALTKPKRFFGAARNIEDGGSLTIVATALVDTGSRMDDVIFEEFKGTGNMEVVLDRSLANQRIWPAINIPASGTRNEDLLLHPEELRRVNLLRRAISAHSPPGAMEAIIDLMRQYKTNAELLMSLG